MIPILDKYIIKLKYKDINQYRTFKSDKEKSAYIALLNKELKIINSNYEKIISNADRIYKEKNLNPNSKISKRCCDFRLLEEKLNQFILNQEKSE